MLSLTSLLVVASVTDTLADWVTGVVDDIGLVGIFVLMAPESACIPIPSEPTMLFAGFAASDGAYPWWAPALVASVANLVGSMVAYAAGYYGRLELLERQRFVHISPKHLEWADRFFARHGDKAVFFSRMLPIVRTFVSLPAGIARMPFGRFCVLTFLGALPWNTGLVLAGYAARDNWDDLRDYLHLIDYAVVLVIVVGAGWLALRWWRGRRAEPAQDAA
ncbi:DedA family protein [Conexibacter sp. SYSU D00693]|uniref:DedA family protein n=1 Tax=Conexibacter sp. SYSU D00693 TaxID=2812560 RepID=UPI00196A2779|nr:DedA family protein [Conexibacter sp. SYSU D00693]